MPANDAAPESIDALLREGAAALAATSDSPRLDAELLLAHVLGLARSGLYGRLRDPVPEGEAARYRALLADRARHRPVAQLTGRREFWSLDLAVTPDVLTPRPESEVLVEQALARLPAGAAVDILDLGTGSGAIALALGRERPAARILATDRSAAALAVAARNAAALGIGNVGFAAGDWYAAIGDRRFGLIVSNPPYVAERGGPAVDPELAFEPRSALYAGPTGLADLEVILAGAKAHLLPGGHVLVEHGADQADAVQALARDAGLVDIATHADLAGLPRVTGGRAPA